MRPREAPIMPPTWSNTALPSRWASPAGDANVRRSVTIQYSSQLSPSYRGRFRLRTAADRRASLSMWAVLAWIAISRRCSAGRTQSGSTCCSKRAKSASVPGAVRALRSTVRAHEAWAAIRARRTRCFGVIAGFNLPIEEASDIFTDPHPQLSLLCTLRRRARSVVACHIFGSPAE